VSEPDSGRPGRTPGSGSVGRWIPILVLVGLALSACGGPVDASAARTAGGPAQAPFTLGLISQSASQWPAYVMTDQDIDAKHGLDVEVVQTGGTANSIQQTLAGEVDAGEVPVEQAIQVAAERGAALRMICGSELYYSTTLVASSDITSLQELRGKRISIVSKEDSTFYLLNELLQEQGIGTDDWQPVFAAANSATRYAALKAGSVDAVVVASPVDLLAEDDGYNVVADLGAEFPDFAFTSFVATQRALQNNRPMLQQFVAAYGESINWLLDPANEQRAREILAANTKLDEQTTGRLYSLLITEKKAFAGDAVLPEAAITAVQERLVGAGLMSSIRPAGEVYESLSALR
jgi:ABC-type nitrate/sulfonate/bicarbonate transport system substrate-binding protein